jgi:hypothetical protein
MQTLATPIQVVAHTTITPTVTQSNDSLWVAQGAATYQWYFEGNAITGATNQFYVPTASGNYTVTTTDVNGCTATSAAVMFVGIENVLEANFAIYPNPVVDEMTIVYNGNHSLDFRIHDVSGKLLKQGACERSLNVADLATGVYLITILDNKLEHRQVFVKQ